MRHRREFLKLAYGLGLRSIAQARGSSIWAHGGAHHRVGGCGLGKTEGGRPSLARDPNVDPDQPELQAGQRPVGHGLALLDAAQGRGKVVDQRLSLSPAHLRSRSRLRIDKPGHLRSGASRDKVRYERQR